MHLWDVSCITSWSKHPRSFKVLLGLIWTIATSSGQSHIQRKKYLYLWTSITKDGKMVMDIHSTSEPASQRMERWWWIYIQPLNQRHKGWEDGEGYLFNHSKNCNCCLPPTPHSPAPVFKVLANRSGTFLGVLCTTSAMVSHSRSPSRSMLVTRQSWDGATVKPSRKWWREQQRKWPCSSIRFGEKIKDIAWVTEQRRTGPCSSIRSREKIKDTE